MSLSLALRAHTHTPPAVPLAGFARRHPLALVIGLAFVIRVALLATPRSYFPDEVFQYLEPAHRLAFGAGVVPWEYRYGVRSWLIPTLLAGPMWFGDWLAPGTGAHLLCAKIALVLASLPSVWAADAIGSRISPRHGLFAAFVMAIWAEAALFGTQALTEALAVPLLLCGTALLPRDEARTGRIALAGSLLTLAVVVRFQYGPAIAVLAAMSCGLDRRRWLLAAAGGCGALVATGCLDIAMGQRPFAWIFENFHQNIGLARSHAWTDGPSFYPLVLVATFGGMLLPLLFLAGAVAPRFPALAACAVVNIAVHTVIAHKEYRYVLASTTILVLLAAIGTIEMTDLARRRTQRRGWPALAAAGWLVASLLFATTGLQSRIWARATPALRASASLRSLPELCGVALVGAHWTETGGYAYLHRNVPLYIPDTPATPPAGWLSQSQAGFDTIMAPAAMASDVPSAYRPLRCFGGGDLCVFHRPGDCDHAAAAAHEINRVLIRTDR